MKKLIPVATGLVAALAFTAALAGEKIQLVERALTDATLDLGAKGDSVGDIMTWANPVFDAANKVQVGTDQGFCIRVLVGKLWECTWTTMLKDGQISVEGPFKDEGDAVVAVIGGTGKYAGAKGQLKLHPRDAKATAYDFIFDLL